MGATTTLVGLAGLLIFLLTVGTLLIGILDDLKSVIDDLMRYGTAMIKYVKGEISSKEMLIIGNHIDNELQRINRTFVKVLVEIFNKSYSFIKISNSSFINVTSLTIEKPGRDHG